MNTQRQSGAALIVALVMLLISTMIGLASIRSATLSERMTANMYDRSIAYQAAEAALRAGEAALENGSVTPIDCPNLPAGQFCSPIPAGAFDPDVSTNWTSVGPSFRVNTELMPNVPEYYVEKMGETGGTSEFGIDDSANYYSYGQDGGATAATAALYRITGRSVIKGDDSAGRSVVALQITVKQNL